VKKNFKRTPKKRKQLYELRGVNRDQDRRARRVRKTGASPKSLGGSRKNERSAKLPQVRTTWLLNNRGRTKPEAAPE